MRAFIVVAIVSMLAGCGGTAHKPFRTAYETQTMGEPIGRIAAAGDIACAPSDPSFHEGFGTNARCRMRATSDVLLTARPIAVLTLGDNQYERGRLSDFLQSYDSSWGSLKAITHPTAGNHEYWTADAAGYFEYFWQGCRAVRRGLLQL